MEKIHEKNVSRGFHCVQIIWFVITATAVPESPLSPS
jgi:hypothetical protein